MRCYNARLASSKEREVLITLKWPELKYDIENSSFIIAHASKEESDKAKHILKDICKEGNVDRVARYLHVAYSICADIMYKFVKTPIEPDGMWVNDILKEGRDFRYELVVPDTFSATTVESLRHYLHEFFVTFVLAEWFLLTYPEAYVYWKDRNKEYEDLIKKTLNKTLKPTRIKEHPFP